MKKAEALPPSQRLEIPTSQVFILPPSHPVRRLAGLNPRLEAAEKLATRIKAAIAAAVELDEDLRQQQDRVSAGFERNKLPAFRERLDELADLRNSLDDVRVALQKARGFAKDSLAYNRTVLTRLDPLGDLTTQEHRAAYVRESARDLAERLRYLGMEVPGAVELLAEGVRK